MGWIYTYVFKFHFVISHMFPPESREIGKIQVNEKPYRRDIGVFLNPAHCDPYPRVWGMVLSSGRCRWPWRSRDCRRESRSPRAEGIGRRPGLRTCGQVSGARHEHPGFTSGRHDFAGAPRASLGAPSARAATCPIARVDTASSLYRHLLVG